MSRYFIVSAVFLIVIITSLSVDGMIFIPWYWYASWALIFSILTGIGATKLSWQYFVPVHYKGNATSNSIAITFDDGPIPGKTDKILPILQQYQVKATFFCIGHRVKQNPELVKQAHDAGHLIGNHSYWHGKLFDLLPASSMTKELADTDQVIQEIIGVRPKFFRPPYGVTNPMLAKAIKRRNYTVIGWSIRSFDTVTADKDKLLHRITKTLKGGDIILLHDHCSSTHQILASLLDHVNKTGLKVVRVDELINEKAYAK